MTVFTVSDLAQYLEKTAKPSSRAYFVRNLGLTYLLDLVEQESKENWRSTKQDLQDSLIKCLMVLIATREGTHKKMDES